MYMLPDEVDATTGERYLVRIYSHGLDSVLQCGVKYDVCCSDSRWCRVSPGV